ncbi:MAG: hypothetical protein M2R45_00250 [Verrucomicrobia subdivision 3 bacterium]|nr:hypothetical protein [Limisphaerales bacterium]MCS1412990.1 hypothetical protein [Limisphaerales bacterium]
MKFTTLKGIKHATVTPAFSYTGDDPAKGFTTVHTSDQTDKTNDVWDWLFPQKRREVLIPAPLTIDPMQCRCEA